MLNEIAFAFAHGAWLIGAVAVALRLKVVLGRRVVSDWAQENGYQLVSSQARLWWVPQYERFHVTLIDDRGSMRTAEFRFWYLGWRRIDSVQWLDEHGQSAASPRGESKGASY
jgi:hypothetical protein